MPEFISGNLAVLPTLAEETDPFRRLISSWLKSGEANGLRPKTLFDYREKTYKFWWWWNEHTRYATKLGQHPKFVTFEEAEQYVLYLRTPSAFRWGVTDAHRQTDNLSPASIAAYGRAVKVFFSWLKKRRHISEDPFDDVSFSVRKQNRIIKTVPAGDLTKLFDFLADKERAKTFVGARDLAILAMLLDSGIRKGELLSARVSDLDMDNCTVRVNGKTGPRIAVFGEVCRNALTNYLTHLENLRPDEPLWQCTDGAELLEGGFASVIRRLRERVGVNFHAHQLRHTFATHLAAQGVGIQDIKNALGHESVLTTEIYLSVSLERQQIVHRANSPLNQLAGVSESIKRRGRPRKER